MSSGGERGRDAGGPSQGDSGGGEGAEARHCWRGPAWSPWARLSVHTRKGRGFGRRCKRPSPQTPRRLACVKRSSTPDEAHDPPCSPAYRERLFPPVPQHTGAAPPARLPTTHASVGQRASWRAATTYLPRGRSSPPACAPQPGTCARPAAPGPPPAGGRLRGRPREGFVLGEPCRLQLQVRRRCRQGARGGPRAPVGVQHCTHARGLLPAEQAVQVQVPAVQHATSARPSTCKHASARTRCSCSARASISVAVGSGAVTLSGSCSPITSCSRDLRAGPPARWRGWQG